MAEHTPYQKKIIQRYYQNFDAIQFQRLSEQVTELYLSEGKKRARIWTQVEKTLRGLEVPETRITHIMTRRDPELLASLLKELDQTKK